jgi:hypothetical protein
MQLAFAISIAGGGIHSRTPSTRRERQVARVCCVSEIYDALYSDRASGPNTTLVRFERMSVVTVT